MLMPIPVPGPKPPQDVRRPLLRVWIRPHGTVRALIARGGWAWAPILLFVATVLNFVWLGLDSDLAVHWFALLIVGIVISLPWMFVSVAIMLLLGWVLRGKANFRTMTIALAWGGVPFIALDLVLISSVALAPEANSPFRAPPSLDQLTANDIVYTFLVIVGIFLLLWGLWTHIRAIGAAHRFGWFRSLVTLTSSILLMLSVHFLWEAQAIQSNSMAPTLRLGDWVFTNKLAYGYGRYSLPFVNIEDGRLWGARPIRGDLIVFRTKSHADFVCRVVGLPGDEMQMTNGVLHINGLPVRMTFLREEKLDETSHFSKSARVYRETLPNGVSYEIFDMVQNGDSDNTSAFRVPSGHYFVLGDSRDNSIDSRFPQVGHVAYEDIVAKAGVIYFSASPPKPDSIFRAFDNINWTRMFRRP